MTDDKRKKLTIAIATVSALSIGAIGVKATTSAIENKKIEREEKKAKEAEEKRIAELKEKYPGVGIKGLDDAYDASIIAEKLKNYDYRNNGEKIVFLTFDDGPSTTVTPEILNTLKANDVKGTFFILGDTLQRNEESKKILKQIYDDGHAIGNHSYSHDYKKLYPGGTLNFTTFKEDFQQNEDLIKEALGEDFNTRIARCPGGYMSWKGMSALDEYSKANNTLIPIDWNALNSDAEGKKKTPDELVEQAIKTSEGKEMVVLLMHDTYGKENTAKALDKIIKYYKDNGYQFKVLG